MAFIGGGAGGGGGEPSVADQGSAFGGSGHKSKLSNRSRRVSPAPSLPGGGGTILVGEPLDELADHSRHCKAFCSGCGLEPVVKTLVCVLRKCKANISTVETETARTRMIKNSLIGISRNSESFPDKCSHRAQSAYFSRSRRAWAVSVDLKLDIPRSRYFSEYESGQRSDLGYETKQYGAFDPHPPSSACGCGGDLPPGLDGRADRATCGCRQTDSSCAARRCAASATDQTRSRTRKRAW